jgi:hypothetical protein
MFHSVALTVLKLKILVPVLVGLDNDICGPPVPLANRFKYAESVLFIVTVVSDPLKSVYPKTLLVNTIWSVRELLDKRKSDVVASLPNVQSLVPPVSKEISASSAVVPLSTLSVAVPIESKTS